MRKTLTGWQHSLKSLLFYYHKFKDSPGEEFIPPWSDWWDAWDWDKFRGWFLGRLHAKISARDPRLVTGRKTTSIYMLNLLSDRRHVEDYLFRRIRNTGCRNLLRTPEMQKRYPHINNQTEEG